MTPAPPIPAPSSVTTDVACAGCGYNLRLLEVEALCPECGRPVQTSLGLPAPEWGDNRWLSRVRLGCGLILGGQGMLLVAFTSGIVTVVNDHGLRLFCAVTLALSLFLDGLGALFIVEPVPAEDPSLTQNRLWVRLTAFLPLAGLFAAFIELPVGTLPPGAVGQIVFALSWAVCIWFTFGYVERLARRAKLAAMIATARAARVGLAPLTGIGLFGHAVGLLHGADGAMCFGVGVAFIFWIAAIIALLNLASATTSYPRIVIKHAYGRGFPAIKRSHDSKQP